MTPKIERFPSLARAAEACGRHILTRLEAAISKEEQATFAISGGSSPKRMFEFFARTPFPWESVQLFWVDERAVPPSDPQSNYKLAADLWLTPAQFPAANVHRILAEHEPKKAAAEYVDEIRKVFQLGSTELPRFDVIHRGMGPDAHTASLFPGEPLIDDREGIAAAVLSESMKQWRITLLPGVLLAAHHTVMLVSGGDKCGPLNDVLNGPEDPKRFPAQIATRGSDRAIWFLDDQAASKFDP